MFDVRLLWLHTGFWAPHDKWASNVQARAPLVWYTVNISAQLTPPTVYRNCHSRRTHFTTWPPHVLLTSSTCPPYIPQMSKDQLNGTIRYFGVTCGQDTGDWLSTIYSELSQLTLQDSRMWEQEPICLGPAEVVLLMHGSNLGPGKVHTPHCWLTLILPTLCRRR